MEINYLTEIILEKKRGGGVGGRGLVYVFLSLPPAYHVPAPLAGG
jgi:hypothetical protein